MQLGDLSKKSKLEITLAVLSFSLVIFIAIPTLANQLEGGPNLSESTTTALSSHSYGETATIVSPESETLTSYADPGLSVPMTGTKRKTIPTALPSESQKFSLGIPKVVPVDPRAKTVYFPKISLSGSTATLVCISADNSSQIDIGQRNVIDTYSSDSLTASGDTTSFLLVSGPANQIAPWINAGGGIAIYNYAQPVANSLITFQVVAVSEPVLDANLCQNTNSNLVRQVLIKPIGITLDTKKGAIPLRSSKP